jgi:hypothetical protein
MHKTPDRKRSLRERQLARELSDVKRPRLAEDVPLVNKANDVKTDNALAVKEVAAWPAEVERKLQAQLDAHGVPASSRARLIPVIRRWGPARTSQVLGLWTFLGDGDAWPVAASTLNVWGAAGTGKTAVVSDFLCTLGFRHVWLNCACFTSRGDLLARVGELLRRSAVDAADAAGLADVSPALRCPWPVGRHFPALDRWEAATRLPLEYIAHARKATGARSSGGGQSVRTMIIFDQAQELGASRFGEGTSDLLLRLPEVMQHGEEVAVVFLSRLPLRSLGHHDAREPPAVVFRSYAEAEAEALLLRELSATGLGTSSQQDQRVKTICGTGLMKFAAPYVGFDLKKLLQIGREVLAESEGADTSMASLQGRIEQAVQRRVGLCDLSGLLERPDCEAQKDTNAPVTMDVANVAMMQGLTKSEKRLLLASYIACRVDKDDDMQLFMAEWVRKTRRKTPNKVVRQKAEDDLPVHMRAPRPTTLARLLAVYHRLARQPQLLGPPLFERLAGLREAGLLAWNGSDATKVLCRVELPLARACAGELDIDLAEYLCSAR